MAEQIDTLDMRGLKCPLPVLKARKAMRARKAGEKVWIETTDPLAVIDIPAYCQEAGHTLVETEEFPDHHRFLVEKAS